MSMAALVRELDDSLAKKLEIVDNKESESGGVQLHDGPTGPPCFPHEFDDSLEKERTRAVAAEPQEGSRQIGTGVGEPQERSRRLGTGEGEPQVGSRLGTGADGGGSASLPRASPVPEDQVFHGFVVTDELVYEAVRLIPGEPEDQHEDGGRDGDVGDWGGRPCWVRYNILIVVVICMVATAINLTIDLLTREPAPDGDGDDAFEKTRPSFPLWAVALITALGTVVLLGVPLAYFAYRRVAASQRSSQGQSGVGRRDDIEEAWGANYSSPERVVATIPRPSREMPAGIHLVSRGGSGGSLLVRSVDPSGPYGSRGLSRGMVVTRICGVPVKGMTPPEVVAIVREAEGSVTVEAQAPGDPREWPGGQRRVHARSGVDHERAKKLIEAGVPIRDTEDGRDEKRDASSADGGQSVSSARSGRTSGSGGHSIARHEINEPQRSAQSVDTLPDMSPDISVLADEIKEPQPLSPRQSEDLLTDSSPDMSAPREVVDVSEGMSVAKGRSEVECRANAAAEQTIMSSECSDPAVANGSAAEESAPTIEDDRILLPREELAEMLRQNDRVSGQSEPPRPRSPNATPTETRWRRWVRCQHPPPRPGFLGVFRSGGTMEDRKFVLGSTLDEIELETKQTDAVRNVRQALNERLGYDLGAWGQYKEFEGIYHKGEERLQSAGIDPSSLRPKMAWPSLPAPSRESILRKEPDLPKITAPLPGPSNDGEWARYLRANLTAIVSEDDAMVNYAELREGVIGILGGDAGGPPGALAELGCSVMACLFVAGDDTSMVPRLVVQGTDVDCVLGTIEARGSHEPGVAEAGCMAVRNFFLTAPVDETASEALLPRALSIVSDVAMAHGQIDLGTLEQALAALRAILHHKASLASRLEGNFVSVITSDSQTGLRPMACGNRNVVYHCVSLLGSVLRGASSIRDEYVNNTVSGGLVDFIMDATADDPDAQCQMEAAMGLVSGGLVDFIMDANDDDPDAQCQMEAAMDLLCFLSGSSYKSRMALLDKGLSKATSIIKAVVKAMEKHPQSAPIQGCGCMVFYNIALDNKLRTDICEEGGVGQVVSSLSILADDAQLVARALLALSNLMGGALVDILRTIDSASIIIKAMKRHPQDLCVQVEGASALWALSATRDNALNSEIVDLDGASVIASAMSQFIASGKMHEKGLAAIWSLCSLVSNEAKETVGRVAINPVVNGLAASVCSDQVVSNGLGCLKCLSTISAIRTLLEESGSIDLVYSCLWIHLQNHSVVQSGLAALCNITINTEANEVMLISEDELAIIVHIMRYHQNVQQVQGNAIQVLKNFTFSPENLAIMGNDPHLPELIRSAKATHRICFQGRADDLLQLLPDRLQ